MIEIKIFCPPINLYSKPWQHAFDKRYAMKLDKNRHNALKLWWERSGRPQLMFKYGDDPWVEVGGIPTFNPAFSYHVKSSCAKSGQDIYDAIKANLGAIGRNEPNGITHTDDFYNGYDYDTGFKHGYAKALHDMRNMLVERQCQNP